MNIDTTAFRVNEGEALDLKQRPTRIQPVYSSKGDYKDTLEEHVGQLSDLQRMHYASNQHSVLLIFQAMDSAGKDGAIRHVMSGINPQGCQVFSFKRPSAMELDHDFLWRSTQCLPERGRIGIFNRSYYEEVLVVRVHPEILDGQGLPPTSTRGSDVWKERYRSIVEHEAHLHRNGTRIVKFFLHLSKEEQSERFLKRIEEPEKNWKFSLGDIEERKFWPQYMEAYEDCLSATSTNDSPWFVVPADDKKTARLIISKIVLNTFKSLNLTYPETSAERRKELLAIRQQLIEQG